MSDILRSEWIKLRTVRVNFVLAIIAGAFPLIIIVLIATLNSKPRQAGDDLVGAVTATMVVTALLLGVIGALNLTSEYSHNTIRTTFAAVPQRRNVLVAKGLVSVVTLTVYAAITELITFAVGSLILNARDGHVQLSGQDKAAMLGLVALVALLILLAYGLGMIIRNSPAAITTFILWPLLLESIARAVLNAAGVDNPTPWLPYQSAFTMANPDPGSDDPGRVRAGLFLAVIALAFLIIGTIINERRDA
jgi:ABC-2 type transport system permease protein